MRHRCRRRLSGRYLPCCHADRNGRRLEPELLDPGRRRLGRRVGKAARRQQPTLEVDRQGSELDSRDWLGLSRTPNLVHHAACERRAAHRLRHGPEHRNRAVLGRRRDVDDRPQPALHHTELLGPRLDAHAQVDRRGQRFRLPRDLQRPGFRHEPESGLPFGRRRSDVDARAHADRRAPHPRPGVGLLQEPPVRAHRRLGR